MLKILLVINHPEEWNQLLPFNAFIHTLKPNYSKVIAAVQYNGYIVISEADELICEKENNFFKYPKMLDTSKREDDLFLEKCVNFCCEKYGVENLDIFSWRETKYNNGVVNVNNIVDFYKKSFEYVKKYLELGKTIKPTIKTFDFIKNKYGDLFKENTFILLTRNFSNKAPIHNTENSLPNLEKLLSHLTENKINIINIGFPPKSYNIDKNYLEINDNLTQDELISLFYLSNGVLTAADAGGFLTHFGSNVDFYILNEEWSIRHEDLKITLLDSKINNNTYNLMNKSDQEILNTLRKNGKPQISDFSNPKTFYFVEEN